MAVYTVHFIPSNNTTQICSIYMGTQARRSKSRSTTPSKYYEENGVKKSGSFGLKAPRDGAIMADQSSPPLRQAFRRAVIVSERSSASRVRFAAPNNGAPLTPPGRSEERLLRRAKGPGFERPTLREPLRRHNGPLFHRHRHPAAIRGHIQRPNGGVRDDLSARQGRSGTDPFAYDNAQPARRS